jgi:hypothetical protein
LFNNAELERARKRAASSKISSDGGKKRADELAWKIMSVFYVRNTIQHLNFGKP